MKSAHTCLALLLAAVGGLLLGLARFGCTSDFARLFAACGIGQLLTAALLASGLLAPGKIWGRSAIGQALQGTWLLIMASMSFAGEPSNTPVAWLLGAGGLALFLIGLRLESKARAQQLYV
jgi:hypothetical protein